MKKLMILCFVLFSFFYSINLLNADCEDLISKSKNVKVYKESIAPKSDKENPTIGVRIENITDDYYVKITNDVNDKEVTIKYSDTENGTYFFKSPNVYKNVKVNVNLYSSNNNVCNSTDSLVNFEVSTDVFNQYYYLNICQNNLDLDMCKPFQNNEELNKEEFVKKIEDDIRVRDMSIFERVWEFIKDYYLYALVPFILLSLIFIIRIVLLKRGKKTDE